MWVSIVEGIELNLFGLPLEFSRLMSLIPAMARMAIIPPPRTSIGFVVAGWCSGLFSSPMIDEMEGYDHNQCNNRVGKEGCEGISTFSVEADVCNDGT